MLASIVIQTKNEQKTLGRILGCLADQTFKDFEIVFVDDNSTDKTLEIIDSFAKKLPIATIVHLKPGEFGYSYSLNLAISKTKGKYIAILVGHALPFTDAWLADGLKNFEDPQVAGISGHYTENPIGYHWQELGKLLFKLEMQRARITFDPWLTNTNSIIRKDLWQKYPFDEKLEECEDYDWACEMLARGYNIIKDSKFSVVHSHWYLGRPGYITRIWKWKKICAAIAKRQRPRKSFTKITIT